MKLALIMAALVVPVASPALAQRQVEMDTGSSIAVPRRARISDAPGLSDQVRARKALADFARCTVDRKAQQMSGILAQPADKLSDTQFSKVADDECLMSGQMRMKPIMMRGAIFVELYRRRDQAERRGSAWSLPTVTFDVRAPVDPANTEFALQAGLLSFASCVVGRDPSAAKAVVLGPTASKEQDAAFAALAPHLGKCLPSGQNIKLGKPILEGALGEVLYRGTVPVASPVSQETR
ncbi:hypothetical protein ACFQ15_16565 [Sphingomonas hankookensis]|uniref:hypothetical protein n=1 Tax=Sphingomonas hankookensis TaxID=563996 RepID=UPI001F58BE24|nr:hypothetical protein [Sphingomonas hankookensis]